uniref:Uncharacterized protein n=1 Tax=Gallus gallus TaxID=9031 RepID=A0A8V0YAG5_CHICK
SMRASLFSQACLLPCLGAKINYQNPLNWINLQVCSRIQSSPQDKADPTGGLPIQLFESGHLHQSFRNNFDG